MRAPALPFNGGSATRRRLLSAIPADILGLLLFLVFVVAGFGATSDRFLTMPTFNSIALQLPELGLLTLAMLMPIISGGFNLSVTYTANIAGLTMASMLHLMGSGHPGAGALLIATICAVAVGALIGFVLGTVIAYVGAHPILVSLAMMLFLRGFGEFITNGRDVSGVPPSIVFVGQGSWLGIPMPLWIFLGAVICWTLLMERTRLGFVTRMVGSNLEATRYSGINTAWSVTMIYTMSGVMCSLAGIVMLGQFNSVRIGHGEAYLLITVLACFLGGVDPFGGFGRVAPVAVALVILQVIASGLNLLGADEHLSTALWGGFLLLVVMCRQGWSRLRVNSKR